jgi:3-deoxy-D-manno-octulosonate 8-phosphate phosphatase (KDO 8-P phosphatase)
VSRAWCICTTCGGRISSEREPAQVTPEQRASRVRLILFDVDGVLTDGRVHVHADGQESKAFFIRDGIAIVWAQRAGLRVGFLSARTSATTPHRAAQLGVTLVYQGVDSKHRAYERILRDEGVSDDAVAYMGDDVVDLAVIGRVGLSGAPADAVAEVREAVHWTSAYPGGSGAAREFLEFILKAQQRWADVVSSYVQEPRV